MGLIAFIVRFPRVAAQDRDNRKNERGAVRSSAEIESKIFDNIFWG